MRVNDSKAIVWVKPEMARIGKIGDVAGPNTGTTENNGGNPCGGGGCGTKGS